MKFLIGKGEYAEIGDLIITDPHTAGENKMGILLGPGKHINCCSVYIVESELFINDFHVTRLKKY